MKKFTKQLFALLIVASMLLSMVTVAVAVTSPTFSIKEEIVDSEEGIKKLVFSIATPESAAGITTTELIFSYDATKIMPVRKDTYADSALSDSSSTTALKRPVKAFEYYDEEEDTEYEFSFEGTKVMEVGNRVALWYVTKSNDPFNAKNGMNFIEFYFRVIDGAQLDGETFQLETDYSDGSPLKTWNPVANLAAPIKTIDKANNVYAYNKHEGSDTAVLSEFTYTGSGVVPSYPLDRIELTAADSVAVPTVNPAQSEATVNFTAKAYNTKNQEMGLPSGASWSLKSAPAGVTINASTGVLTVAPAATAGTAIVAITAEGKEFTKEIAITREAPVAKVITLKANGADVTNLAVIKPVTSADPAKNVVFTADANDQYGDIIATDITISATSLEGTSFANNTLTVNSVAVNGDITVTATADTLSDTINVKIASLDVNWSDVNVTDITYGQKVSDAVELPTPNAGTATANGTVYNGTFSVLNPDIAPVVGSANVQVAFTITDDGEFKNTVITKDFSFNVNKADYNMNAVTVANKEVTYNGQPQEIVATGTLPSGVSVSNTTYNGSTEKPVNAGTYNVVVSFAGDEANYNPIPDKTATLTISKADAVITANEVQTFTYDSTAKSAAATLSHNETTLTYSADSFVNVGEYDVTITAAETANYKPATKQVTVVINKAVATGFATPAPTFASTAKDAFDAGYTSTDAIKNAMNLPAIVTATYAGGTEDVNITWADAPEAWNAKGATYTFKGTATSDNLSFPAGVELTATATVSAVNASIDTALNSVTVAESTLQSATSYSDIVRLPGNIALSTYGGVINITPVWNKTIDELKALAVGESVTLEVTNLPVWATVPAATLIFSVTDKYPVEVTVSLPSASYVYGTAIDVPTAFQAALDDGTDDTATFKYTYEGTTVYDAVYSSTTAPVTVGTYKVIAELESATHYGKAEYSFTITPLGISYEVNDVNKKYKEANPAFTGFVTSALAYADTEADLGVNFLCADTTDYTVGQTANVLAAISNLNYTLTHIEPGTLTVIKKPLTDADIAAPAINGIAAVGETLTASIEGVDASEYDCQWYVDGIAVAGATAATYVPVIADSNKAITVEIIAKDAGNYEGTVTSDAVTVAKYSITGLLTANITDGALGTPAVLDAGDTVAIDVTSIDNYAELIAAGITFDYQWYVNGTAIEGETASSITLAQGLTGTLTVKVTATGNFTGTIEHSLGEINKLALTGAITITLADGVISYTSTLPGTVGTDYTLTWYRGTDAVGNGATYTVTPADYGKTITLKATAVGNVYTGEVTSGELTVPAIAPANVTITVTESTSTLIAKFTADENGAAITQFDVTLTDGTNTQTAVVTPVNGQFNYTFTGLKNGTAYTITATATNAAGTSAATTVTATPRAASGGGNYTTYTVKFNTNGGSTVRSQTLSKGGVATEPAAPTKEGYTFEGWFKDSACTEAYVFGSPVKSSVTIYAKWTKDATDEPEDPDVPDEPGKLSFKDISEDEWFYDNVKYVVENKLMNGVDADFFAPNAALTRAMLVTILYRNEGEPATNRSIPFADVDMGAYYANAVSWAKQNGIVNGVNDVDFAPDNYITREQIAAIIFRYAQYKGMDAITLEENLHFDDNADISEYAITALNWAVGTGLMKGKTATTINPKDNATRAELAAIIQRFLESK